MAKIVHTVTTDLVFDQRMQRICRALVQGGHQVLLVGRRKKGSPELNEEAFEQKRLSCFFEKGPWFYVEYNIRLFFYLLFVRADIFCGIDLDASLPPLWTSKIRNKPFVHDAHEYFTEMEELIDRPKVQKVWKAIEKLVFKNLKYGYTVSEGYIDLFKSKYGVELGLVRNVTSLRDRDFLPRNKKTILYQGAVNVGRGLEPLIMAMHKIDAELIICGQGDIFNTLNALVRQQNLENKVKFMGYVEPKRLVQFTENASIGITLFQAKGNSNKYSMANRFFDYIHSEVPQLAMNYPDYKRFNSKFEVAYLIDDLEPFTIASALNNMLKNENYYQRLVDNTKLARKEVNWQNESKTLLKVYDRVIADAGI